MYIIMVADSSVRFPQCVPSSSGQNWSLVVDYYIVKCTGKGGNGFGRTLVVSFSLDYDPRHQQIPVLVTRDGQLWVIPGNSWKGFPENKIKDISLLGYPCKFNQIGVYKSRLTFISINSSMSHDGRLHRCRLQSSFSSR